MGATWWFLTYWNKTKHQAIHIHLKEHMIRCIDTIWSIIFPSYWQHYLPAADQLPFLGRQLHRPILDNSLPSQADGHLWLANGVRWSRPIIGHAKKSIAAQLAMYHMHQSKQQRTCSCSGWDMSTSFLCAISLSKQKRKKREKEIRVAIMKLWWNFMCSCCVMLISDMNSANKSSGAVGTDAATFVFDGLLGVAISVSHPSDQPTHCSPHLQKGHPLPPPPVTTSSITILEWLLQACHLPQIKP